MNRAKRRIYPKTFKREAVHRVASGRPAGAVAKELGLRETVLRRWMMEFGMQVMVAPRRLGTEEAPLSPADLVAEPSAFVRRRATEREEKIEALLHVAARAFGEGGYHRTTLDEIAERLGVTKPWVYYYAVGRDELIAAVVMRAIDQILAFGPVDVDAPGLDQLNQMLRHYAEVVATDFGRCLVQLNDAELAEPVTTRIRAGKRAIDSQIRTLIDKGKGDGSIAPCDTRLTAFMLAGAVNGIGGWFREAGSLSPAAVAEIYVNQMATGLAPRG